MASASVKANNSIAPHAMNNLPVLARRRKLPRRLIDDAQNISNTTERTLAPEILPVNPAPQVYYCANKLFLAYLVCAIVVNTDQSLIMRLLASAYLYISKTRTAHPFRAAGTAAITVLDHLEVQANIRDEENVANDVDVDFGIDDLEVEVSYGELRQVASCHENEIACLIGMYFFAGVKTPTQVNLAAFNGNRRSAVSSFVGTQELGLFTDDSDYLDLSVLTEINATFNSMALDRANLMMFIVDSNQGVKSGPAAAFQTMFGLLVDQGMSALRMIRELIEKYGAAYYLFPELHGEFEAADNGIAALRNIPNAAYRPYAKSIYGSSFVPVKYASISSLIAVAKTMLSRSVTTYGQYAGAQPVAAFQQRIDEFFKDDNTPSDDSDDEQPDDQATGLGA